MKKRPASIWQRCAARFSKEQLEGQYRVPSTWPNRRDLDAFDRWFEWSLSLDGGRSLRRSASPRGDVNRTASFYSRGCRRFEFLDGTGFSKRTLTGNLDWKQWLGSASQRELDPVRFFNWYYFWDYSGGLLVGLAAHIIDCIQWFMNLGEPIAVTCTGAQPNLPGAEVPETVSLAIEYPRNYLVTFTNGYKTMRYNAFNDQLKQFHGNRARLDVGHEWYSLYPESTAVEMKPSIERKEPGSFEFASPRHISNFMECIRTRGTQRSRGGGPGDEHHSLHGGGIVASGMPAKMARRSSGVK